MRYSKIPKLGRKKIDPDAPILGQVGSLVTRLARTKAEIRAAQSLRYQVFYNELGANPKTSTRVLKRDKDEFDRFCDHLLVIDTAHHEQKIVGTYRLLPQSEAEQAGGFYTQSEFNISLLLNENKQAKMLELGRSCILPEYRNKRTMELLWHGTWSYVLANKIDVMFGCASFEGTDPEPYSAAFSWLSENSMLPPSENCPANSAQYVPLDGFRGLSVDLRKAMSAMPPLLKGYLRLGAKIGPHAVIDRQFGTIDVLVIVKVAQINPRYLAHFGADASRFAA